MGRKSYFDRNEIIDAALDIISREGLKALTMQSLAQKIHAPVGSIYHRFSSRDELLAALWLKIVKSFQEGFLADLNTDGQQAALYTIKWVRANPKEAHILHLYRREELSSGTWPEEFKQKVADLSRELDDGIRTFVKKRFGRVTKDALERTVFAIIDVPFAAASRSIQNEAAPSRLLDSLVKETYITLLGRNNR